MQAAATAKLEAATEAFESYKGALKAFIARGREAITTSGSA
jgi:hypothetical protein